MDSCVHEIFTYTYTYSFDVLVLTLTHAHTHSCTHAQIQKCVIVGLAHYFRNHPGAGGVFNQNTMCDSCGL